MFYTYILYSQSADRFYVGSCQDLNTRLLRHNSSAVPSTKAFAPWKIVYYETFENRADAIKREREIKSKKSRKYIHRLVELADTSRL
ncbi:MAG: GIY-YIG nuclease family protein [Chitinophagales bacterium]|nr:GIY-YIG nuclease family protein [Chitinophagales bacterium]